MKVYSFALPRKKEIEAVSILDARARPLSADDEESDEGGRARAALYLSFSLSLSLARVDAGSEILSPKS